MPGWATGAFSSVTRTDSELSVVCSEVHVPSAVKADKGWLGIEVAGPLDLVETGVLASIADPLRDANVSIFTISTYDTDYILVNETEIDNATAALTAAGFEFED